MYDSLTAWLDANEVIAEHLAILGVLAAALLSYLITSRYLLAVVARMARHTRTQIDDILFEHRVFNRMAFIVPAVVVYTFSALFGDYEADVQRFCVVVMALAAIFTGGALLEALEDIIKHHPKLKLNEGMPIHNYVHLVRIFLYLIGTIVVISIWTGKSPSLLLTGIGAMMAVILLIFKDTILSLVASVQISTKDLVREGDWLEMPKYGADGNVVELSLHTVKIQNWDKTFTVIPTYQLLNEPFKNWRGMQASGGRRIKRAIHIDVSSIKFLDEATIERFRKSQLITGYLEDKVKDIAAFNKEHKFDTEQLTNGRHLTNIGTFRAYCEAYLHYHHQIHEDMTFLVRQLPPGPEGLPIQIYVFTNTTDWVAYEGIQSDIFDHLLAVVPLFDLKVYQNPTGSDFQQLSDRTAAGPPIPAG